MSLTANSTFSIRNNWVIENKITPSFTSKNEKQKLALAANEMIYLILE